MTIEQTVEIAEDRWLHLELPMAPLGKAKVTVTIIPEPQGPQTPARRFAPPSPDGLGIVGECPICAQHPTPNAETIAAFEEGDAMLRGEIPSPTFHSLDELLADLRS